MVGYADINKTWEPLQPASSISMADGDSQPRPPSAFNSPTFHLDMSIRVDQPVGSASISPAGRDVVLASREGLHIIDLDYPYSQPRHLPHRTPWEVADVQWSPFASRDYWVVSTSNQKALVWNLAMPNAQDSIEQVLHAHSRAITDINFSASHPDILATCGVDSFVHCWDLRHPARPSITFCDWFAAATQVKWNRQDPHILASSHDRFLRIWDDRKGAFPLKSIEAHRTKIYGVDWNRWLPDKVITCSLDKTIKFWDYKTEEVPERVIQTPFPVWRARHTPFGWGVLAMPQRGNNDLHLYDRRLAGGDHKDSTTPSVHTFDGHKDQVKEFLWRPRGTIEDGIDQRDFQLVSWGADKELRLHKVDPETLKQIGHEKGRHVDTSINLTRKGAVYKSFREIDFKGERKFSAYPGSALGALTTGMSKAPVPGSRPWTEGGFMTSTARMQRITAAKKDSSPIAWMQGVKIGKGDAVGFSGKNQLVPRAMGTMGPWDAPESLEDEITHVGSRFSKVTFDEVSVQDRRAIISLNGPWGAAGKVGYVKVQIRFPRTYPETTSPQFRLEKTSSIPDKIFDQLSKNLQMIADSWVSRGRGCLEAIICYLLGEYSLEESVPHMLNDREETLRQLDTQERESSSDEEDDNIGGLTKVQSHEIDTSGSLPMPRLSGNTNVPLPKACGANFSHDGRLICFFPPKEDKQRSLLTSIPMKDGEKLSKGPKIFEGFGRLHTSSPGNKFKLSSIPDEEGEGLSDSSTTSLSSSSSSSEGTSAVPDRFRPTITLRFQRKFSTDQSQRSSAGTAGAKSTGSRPKNIISIHNLEDLLPSKRYLAEEYAIFGEGSDVCNRNAEIALKYGHSDLADIWGLIGLILQNRVPLKIMPQSLRREHVLIVARQAMNQVNKRDDSGVELSSEDEQSPDLTGRVKWGYHPFGGNWLIDLLFEFFEQRADVQMLAMLACMFSEPAAKEGVSNAMMHLRQQEIPMSMKSPAYSLDYFQSPVIAWSLYRPMTSIPPTPSIAHTPLDTYGSANSSNGLWGSDPVTPFAGDTNTSSGYFPSRPSSIRQTQSLSASPDRYQQFRRTDTAMTNSFTTAVSRQTSTPSSSSPPNERKKRVSLAENITTPISVSAVTWGANTFFGRSPTNKDQQSSIPTDTASQSEVGTDEDRPRPKSGRVKIQLKNQNLFDDEGRVSVPLLDPARPGRYKAYRGAYAELLSHWGLILTRVEVLKFNGLDPYFTLPSRDLKGSVISIGKKRAAVPEMDTSMEVRVAVHCARCGILLQNETGSIAGACESCNTKQRRNACVICNGMIIGLYAPCLNCGHVMHSKCHQEWFAVDEAPGVYDTCPAGCDCYCAKYTSIDVFAEEARETDTLTIREMEDEGQDENGWEHLGEGGLGRGIGGGLSRGLGSRVHSRS